MRTIIKTLIAVSLIGSSLLVAAPAQAAPAPAASYGQHVAGCARGMGFDGTHNPGMHHGKAGWDPSHTCSMMP